MMADDYNELVTEPGEEGLPAPTEAIFDPCEFCEDPLCCGECMEGVGE